MLSLLNVCPINVQALRIFRVVDFRHEDVIDMAQFETLLMALDIIGVTEIPLLDVYESFIQLKKVVEDTTQKVKPDGKLQFEVEEGLDFSGFCEACEMLGVKDTESKLMNIFCEVVGCKTQEIPVHVMTHDQFKRGWVRVADVGGEMLKRQLKPDNTPFGASRNRDRLLRFVLEHETAYSDSIGHINEYIERRKQERRQKKDDKRIAEQDLRDRLVNEANKFSAIRSQEKRLLIKKEQVRAPNNEHRIYNRVL